MVKKEEETVEDEVLEVKMEAEIPEKIEPAKVTLSPEFIAAKRRDLAIEVAKKLGGLE